jgi:hypothetical protein
VYYSDVGMVTIDVGGVGNFTRRGGSPMPGSGDLH